MRSTGYARKRLQDSTAEQVWAELTRSLTKEALGSSGTIGQSWLPGSYLDGVLRRSSASGTPSQGDVFYGASASGNSTYYLHITEWRPYTSFTLRESHWNPLETPADDPSRKAYSLMEFVLTDSDGCLDVRIRRQEVGPFRLLQLRGNASLSASRLHFILDGRGWPTFGRSEEVSAGGYTISRS